MFWGLFFLDLATFGDSVWHRFPSFWHHFFEHRSHIDLLMDFAFIFDVFVDTFFVRARNQQNLQKTLFVTMNLNEFAHL